MTVTGDQTTQKDGTKNAIRIHTYDWFVERLLGIVEYDGMPRASPDVLRPLREHLDEVS